MRCLILAAVVMFFVNDPASACAIIEGSAAEWVDNADVIVRARALDQRERLVRLEVIETLKGKSPSVLEFEGELTNLQVMDENEPVIPRRWVRKGGRGGNCHALHYRAGEEYLLMLKSRNGPLSPYWAAMAATNEHIEGPADPWLRWVRDRLAERGKRRP